MMIDETKIEFGTLQKIWWNIRIAVGGVLNYFLSPAQELELVEKRALVLAARSPGPRLSADEISHMKKYMLDVQDRELRREYFKTTPIERTFQGLLLPLIEQIVSSDASVKKIINIGASYAYVDSLLAQKYPSIQLSCVDFAANLSDYNNEFARDNLEFISGYAMEILEKNELNGDVFFFGNAAYEIKNSELLNYFKQFQRNGAKYVVLNEPIYPMPGGRIIDPLEVSINNSKPVYSHQGIGSSRHGPLGRVHNYKAMLEEAGFRVIYYKTYKPNFTNLRVVNVIAKRN